MHVLSTFKALTYSAAVAALYVMVGSVSPVVVASAQTLLGSTPFLWNGAYAAEFVVESVAVAVNQSAHFALCAARGSGWHAATVQSAEVNAAIGNMSVWSIGLAGSDADDEGNWTFTAGRYVGQTFYLKKNGTAPACVGGFFCNWHGSNPDNYLGIEHYLSIWTANQSVSRQWNDRGSITSNYACERSYCNASLDCDRLGTVAARTDVFFGAAPNCGCACRANTSGPRCASPVAVTATSQFAVAFSPHPLTFAAGRALCAARGEGWHIASVFTAAAQVAIAGLTSEAMLLGGTDAAVEGEWRWTDGPLAGQVFWRGRRNGTLCADPPCLCEPGMYCQWNSHEPNNGLGGGEHYLHLHASASSATRNWNDIVAASPFRAVACERAFCRLGYGCHAANTLSLNTTQPRIPGVACGCVCRNGFSGLECADAAAVHTAVLSSKPYDAQWMVQCENRDLTWTEATALCKARGDGWGIASVPTTAAQTALNALAPVGQAVWLGANDVSTVGLWRWATTRLAGRTVFTGRVNSTTSACTAGPCTCAVGTPCAFAAGEPTIVASGERRFLLLGSNTSSSPNDRQWRAALDVPMTACVACERSFCSIEHDCVTANTVSVNITSFIFSSTFGCHCICKEGFTGYRCDRVLPTVEVLGQYLSQFTAECTSQTLMSRADAAARCAAQGNGWHLANVANAAVELAITSMVNDFTFVSGSDAQTEGVWQWDHGRLAGTVFWRGQGGGKNATCTVPPCECAPGMYCNWGHSQPNAGNLASNADYLSITTNYWNDVNEVTDTYCFACERSFCGDTQAALGVIHGHPLYNALTTAIYANNTAGTYTNVNPQFGALGQFFFPRCGNSTTVTATVSGLSSASATASESDLTAARTATRGTPSPSVSLSVSLNTTATVPTAAPTDSALAATPTPTPLPTVTGPTASASHLPSASGTAHASATHMLSPTEEIISTVSAAATPSLGITNTNQPPPPPPPTATPTASNDDHRTTSRGPTGTGARIASASVTTVHTSATNHSVPITRTPSIVRSPSRMHTPTPLLIPAATNLSNGTEGSSRGHGPSVPSDALGGGAVPFVLDPTALEGQLVVLLLLSACGIPSDRDMARLQRYALSPWIDHGPAVVAVVHAGIGLGGLLLHALTALAAAAVLHRRHPHRYASVRAALPRACSMLCCPGLSLWLCIAVLLPGATWALFAGLAGSGPAREGLAAAAAATLVVPLAAYVVLVRRPPTNAPIFTEAPSNPPGATDPPNLVQWMLRPDGSWGPAAHLRPSLHVRGFTNVRGQYFPLARAAIAVLVAGITASAVPAAPASSCAARTGAVAGLALLLAPLLLLWRPHRHVLASALSAVGLLGAAMVAAAQAATVSNDADPRANDPLKYVGTYIAAIASTARLLHWLVVTVHEALTSRDATVVAQAPVEKAGVDEEEAVACLVAPSRCDVSEAAPDCGLRPTADALCDDLWNDAVGLPSRGADTPAGLRTPTACTPTTVTTDAEGPMGHSPRAACCDPSSEDDVCEAARSASLCLEEDRGASDEPDEVGDFVVDTPASVAVVADEPQRPVHAGWGWMGLLLRPSKSPSPAPLAALSEHLPHAVPSPQNPPLSPATTPRGPTLFVLPTHPTDCTLPVAVLGHHRTLSPATAALPFTMPPAQLAPPPCAESGGCGTPTSRVSGSGSNSGSSDGDCDYERLRFLQRRRTMTGIDDVFARTVDTD